MTFRLVLIACTIAVSSVLMSSLMTEAKPYAVTICDAREFRQTIVSYCAFQRRDIHAAKYKYIVGDGNNGANDVRIVEHGEPKAAPIVYYPLALKYKRELYLHRKCCLKGCSVMDFAGAC